MENETEKKTTKIKWKNSRTLEESPDGHDNDLKTSIHEPNLGLFVT